MSPLPIAKPVPIPVYACTCQASLTYKYGCKNFLFNTFFVFFFPFFPLCLFIMCCRTAKSQWQQQWQQLDEQFRTTIQDDTVTRDTQILGIGTGNLGFNRAPRTLTPAYLYPHPRVQVTGLRIWVTACVTWWCHYAMPLPRSHQNINMVLFLLLFFILNN